MSAPEPPRILVTRPVEQATRTAARLREMGYEPVLAPLLRIEPITPPDLPDFATAKAILVTSAYAIVRLAALTPVRSVPILSVGNRTASQARALGFSDVTSAGGDGTALRALAEALPPEGGAIIHVRGTKAAVRFEHLAELGHSFREVVVYEAIGETRLPPEVQNLPPDAALIYSARTAEILGRLWRGPLLVIGISEAALAPLHRAKSFTCHAARHPDEASIFNRLHSAVPPG